MSVFKKLAGETVIYGISNILPRILHYVIFTFYLTYKFSEQSDYGIYLDLYAYAAMLLIVYRLGMETSFFRFATGEKANLEKSYSASSQTILITSVFFTILFIIFAPQVADMLRYPDKVEYVYWFAVIIALDALSAIPFARFRIERRPVRFASLKVFNTLFTIVLVVFFLDVCPYLIDHGWQDVFRFYDPAKKLDYVFMSNLIASAAVIILLIPQIMKIKLEFDWSFLKKMILYGLPMALVGAAGVFNQSFSIPIIKYILGDNITQNLAAAGVYGAAAKLALIMNLFTVAYTYAAEPFFFTSSTRSDSRELYASSARLFAMFGSVFFLFILLYQDIIVFVLGPNFRSETHVLPILLMSYIFLGLYYNVAIWYKIKDRTNIGALISVGGAIITIAINFIFIPIAGVVTAAWASFVCYAFMMMAGYLIGQKYFPVPYNLMKIGYYIGFALIIYVTNLYLRRFTDGLPVILSVNSALFLIYLLMIYITEKKWLIGVIRLK
ncbi:MAG TPA: polysaccharide biosynthesis C-terminal domain-containing protein [Saprospiraceae bacterium]|nr:polysaccharide biosynthesis C-terminal domain-containing protein [Saprospiraceae bacterium]